METVKRVGIYARISTHEQSVGMQIQDLRAYAALRGWQIVNEYCDLGISGAKDVRPALSKLIAAAHAREVDIVLCWKIDRLGRSLKHLVTTVADLQEYGCAFCSLKDDIDLSTPAGKLMFHVISAMAEFERSLIVGRVNAGIASAKARGVKFGRPRVHVSGMKVAALREAGVPWRQTAKRMGSSVGSCLRAFKEWKSESAA